jgi:hypothetical protein
MISLVARLADLPFRGRPGLNGALFGLGILLASSIVIPPLFWALDQLFHPAFAATGRALAWWAKLWS